MTIRHATMDDLEIITLIETTSFHKTEAAINLTDDMFHTPEKYDIDGAWLMLLSVATHPFHRYRGYAQRVMRQVIADSREQGRKGLVLTCKEHLIPFYQKFGFKSEGKSDSTHGGAVWYQMRLTF